MSVREWTESSWSFRALTSLPSPIPDSRLLKLIPRLDLVALPLLALAVTHAHGVLAGIAAGVAGVALTELAFWRPAWAVALLLFAFGAGPRLDAHLRMEDFVVLGLVLSALRKRGTVATPLDTPIAIFVAVAGLALVVGLASGTIAQPVGAALTTLKIVEYIVGFYAAWIVGIEVDRPLITAVAILAIAAIAQLIAFPSERPFDRWPYKAESNHVGGFAVLATAHFLSRGRKAFALLASGLTIATGSRVAFVALALVCLLQHGRLSLLILVGLAAGAWFFQRERVSNAPNEWNVFRRTENRVAEGYPPAFSYTRNRIECWSLLSEDFARYPIIGTGPGSRDRVIYENAYVMLAGETGTLGVLAFALLIVAVLFALYRSAHAGRDSAYGAAGATAAMMVLATASISFFLAREAGVWWMLIGSALNRPRLQA